MTPIEYIVAIIALCIVVVIAGLVLDAWTSRPDRNH